MAVYGGAHLWWHKRLKGDPTPLEEASRNDYVLLTGMGASFFIISCIGCFGVYERKPEFVKSVCIPCTIRFE